MGEREGGGGGGRGREWHVWEGRRKGRGRVGEEMGTD